MELRGEVRPRYSVHRLEQPMLGPSLDLIRTPYGTYSVHTPYTIRLSDLPILPYERPKQSALYGVLDCSLLHGADAFLAWAQVTGKWPAKMRGEISSGDNSDIWRICRSRLRSLYVRFLERRHGENVGKAWKSCRKIMLRRLTPKFFIPTTLLRTSSLTQKISRLLLT